MTSAAILGLDTAAGAYLARLLGARGHAVCGSGDARLLEILGIAGDVARDDDVAACVHGVDEVYDLRGDVAATTALLAVIDRQRLFVAAEPETAIPSNGRFVAVGRLWSHESRLGPGTSPVARIVAAAAAGRAFDPADLASATDCGWTAEVVDALSRMLQRPAPLDLAIATGRLVTGNAAARVAAAFFDRAAPPEVVTDAGIVGDPWSAATVLGWRAVTFGDDLVTVLCEGAGGA